ncbi:CYTH domain-containing protein [Kitasatospora sp. NBC_01250]|uniref:CYTH domain-containing protein n=1 Tax=unclassified Kitasatospora TaxID=2633591 RepID=UPI002E1480D0|nr:MULTISPECIES: CYTH domain-containing protein [unclassified Kitasatospora]WSJ70778.1 CYTH domain-containing protein [Kitasatospora sp. NBC_01302]
MGTERERKFLVTGEDWRAEAVSAHRIRQGFLSRDLERVVRIRVVDDRAGYLTVKGARSGISRPEYEYPIPVADAIEMLDRMCLPGRIDKVRHVCGADGYQLTVDEFGGVHQGLLLAEVEYDEGVTDAVLPGWLGTEVTDDDRYSNAVLAAGAVPGAAGAPEPTRGSRS